MLKSIKSQIVVGTSAVIVAILLVATYFFIDHQSKQIRIDIFNNAVSFAELTHERVISNYETNYTQKAYAHFERGLADIYQLNEDIKYLNIYRYDGSVAYHPSDHKAEPVSGLSLERVQAILPSVVTDDGRLVYLDKTDGEIRFTDFNGKRVSEIKPTEKVLNVIYPFRDSSDALRSFSIEYHVSYDQLAKRVQDTRNNLIVLSVFGILIALLVGGVVADRITSPILKLTAGAVKIGSGELKTRINVQSKSEVGQLAQTFNQMAADLEKSTQVLVEQEKITHELELAGEIQMELLPDQIPKIQQLDIAASLISADEVGGDGYDFLKMDDDRWIFYVGDVTGHGVPAGLVSAINNALVPAFMHHYQTPKDLVINLNRILKEKTRSSVFLTMMMAQWSISRSTLTYTPAGHNPILFYQASQNKVHEMPTGGMALGMIPDISDKVDTYEINMQPGDIAVLYTDGIPEAWKDEKENYGMERFNESILRASKLNTAQEVHDAIYRDLQAFTGDYPQADDITLMVIKRTN